MKKARLSPGFFFDAEGDEDQTPSMPVIPRML